MLLASSIGATTDIGKKGTLKGVPFFIGMLGLGIVWRLQVLSRPDGWRRAANGEGVYRKVEFFLRFNPAFQGVGDLLLRFCKFAFP